MGQPANTTSITAPGACRPRAAPRGIPAGGEWSPYRQETALACRVPITRAGASLAIPGRWITAGRREINLLPCPSGKLKGMTKPRIYTMIFADVYPLYVAKAEKKSRTQAEVDEIIRWLTGYSQAELAGQIEQRKDFETFFAEAPRLNPARALITGMVCGVRVEAIEDPLMREIRSLDKLIDELAKGKAMEKILRKE
jgi:hypothetical protein